MIEKIKELLKQEPIFQIVEDNRREYNSCIEVMPILHNEKEIILQFNGWSINLYNDGTYIWEATDGG